MNIAFECYFFTEQINGINRFTIKLINELLKIDKDNSYYCIIEDKKKHILNKFISSDKVNYCLTPLPYICTKSIIKKFKIDILISPTYITIPQGKLCKHIVIVHDLIPFIFKQYFKQASLKFKLFHSNYFLIKYILNKASHVVTVSNSTKNDLINYLNINENSISIVYEGVSLENRINDKSVLKKYNINKKYILYVGRFEPYKNVLKLIEIYSDLGELKDNFELVIVGKKDKYFKDLYAKVIELNLIDNVKFTDFVPDNELSTIYQNATIFVYPSLYEGFGLTVLDAMYFKLPVIAFNTSSLKEIVGYGGLLIEAYNIEAMKETIKNLLINEDKRKELSSRAYNKASKFSWNSTANEFLKIIKKPFF